MTFGVSALLALGVVLFAARTDRSAAAAAPPATNAPALPVEPAAAPPSPPPPSFAGMFVEREGVTPPTTLTPEDEAKIVARARGEIGRVTVYDNSWMQTSAYPNGDVPESRGACTDVVVRSLRAIGIDLQVLVHEDIGTDIVTNEGRSYKLAWRDHHIDHRRVTTMHTFFERNTMSLPTDVRAQKATFRPGDVVFFTWSWGRSALAEHVAIVSDVVGPRGYPLLVQNGGPRPSENDSLDRPHMVGHYRLLPKR